MVSNTSFIIPNFFHTVQNAAITILSPTPIPADDEQEQLAVNEKIKKIAIAHLAGAAVMAVGTLISLAALPYVVTTTIGFALLATLGVAIYAIGHDVFTLANNAKLTQQNIEQLTAQIIARGQISDQENALPYLLTYATFFQPIILKFFAQHLNGPAAAPAGGVEVAE